MTTHILEIAERVCDRIGIINEGKLVAVGTMDELRQNRTATDLSLEDIFLELTENVEDEIV
jgi:ABC-2 type transport system ATP-binding protein